ncbi:hypothetical protein LX16_4501 [Stackebrandtia albiflava]|uniref:Uncharacterized protein n=1 Tax=Stackebrandtia albiflava TaxID=406432 RepID=A0A562URN4_9ACTN|nr:hypothetical protein [Stackebrandtia albiflava]TWJ08276.1 hypothetical protein LX16_4501 [Stackebrandtia albiflava]
MDSATVERLATRLRALATTRSSASGAVTVTISSGSGPRVRIDDEARLGHDEHSLATEIEYTVYIVEEEYFGGLMEMSRRVCGRLGIPWDDTAAPEDRAWSEVEALGTGESDDGAVRVTVFDGIGIAVEFRHNAVRRTDVSTVALETGLDQAMAAARRERRRALGRARAARRGD